MRKILVLVAGSLFLISSASASQQTAAPAPTPGISGKTAGMEKRDGFIPLYLDSKQGKIFLEIPRDSMRTLMFMTLATGLGSNPIGLDRGADGPQNIARFDRNGDRVLVVFENWNYRTSLNNPAQARTIVEAFPPSTVASLPLIAEEGGRLLVDATDFFMRDWLDVAATLAAQNEGSYSVAKDRSSVYKPYTKSFPLNTEIDISLTFTTSGRPGNTVSSIVPDGQAFTLRQHVSILPLPDDSYKPRTMDPRGHSTIVLMLSSLQAGPDRRSTSLVRFGRSRR